MLILYTILPTLILAENSLTIEYYKNLINQRTKEAENYKLPENNEEFKTGLQATTAKDFGSFDFIIVGGGSAGSVLTTRLSEISDLKILLLEAGGEEDDFSEIPGMFYYQQFSKRDWGFYTTRQNKSCLGMKDQRCHIPRGRTIGGSGATNNLKYFRGNPKDYNKWVQLGNLGWSFFEVFPYFLKSENAQNDGDPGYHGKGGLWNVQYSEPTSPLYPVFLNANSEFQVPHVDYNGKTQCGVSQIQFNIKHGRRQSLATVFLDNARARKNVTVVTKALVTKVIIDPKSKTAQGVEFVTEKEKFQAKARKEVIISGGAISTPQILMLSGVGPKNHLKELGIKVIADLPVGKNLLDHPLFPNLVFRTNYTIESDKIEEQIKMYLKGLGPLTKPASADAVGLINTGETPKDVPTIEYIFTPQTGSSTPITNRVYNFNDKIVNEFTSKVNPKTDLSLLLALLHEKSRGQITLKSADPLDYPNIDLNMFDEQEDVDTMIKGIEFVMELFKTGPLKAINATLLDYPICTEFKKFSNKFWECLIRHMTATIYHPCGTTAMGPNPRTSVVNNVLKVHGIGHLRVVDAGIFPSTISGHTNAPTVMVAEKIADIIKKTYGYWK